MLELLDRILPSAERPRVLVVGDLILDEFLHGRVHRISPEAPVPVLESAASHRTLGGAANVAHNLATLGCEVWLVGIVGDDPHGRALIEMLEQKGIHTDGILVDGQRPTTHKLRVGAQGQQILRIDREERGQVNGELTARLAEQVGGLAAKVEGIVVSDYQKGVLSPRMMQAVVAAAVAAKLEVAVDPKGMDYGRYRGVTALTPNLGELQLGAGMEVTGETARAAAVERLFSCTASRAVLVTCGKDGMVLYERGRAPVAIAAEAREVFDVTGAGDTVIAVFSLGMFRGLALADAARLANSAAGIVVGKLGTATVSREELGRALHAAVQTQHPKIVSMEGLRRELDRERANGRKIILTNGCFDLLHRGHVAYLEAARKLGDLLVVGLNSDRSVREIKGDTRPLVPEADRAYVLAALGCVDYVVVFDEPTPARLVAEVRPDVLVKGGDYRPEDVVGRDTVESYGGRVEIVPLVEGQSTSALIGTILDRHRAS